MTDSERWWARTLGLLAVVVAMLAGGLTVAATPAAAAEALAYPDLVTLPPRDLRVERADVSVDGSGQMHNVLKFTNTPWNRGEGQFLLRAVIDPLTGSGPAYQRIFDGAGAFVDRQVGTVTYHGVHGHYHFDGWGSYELWTKPAYDAWIASGRTTGAPQWTSPKTTSCVLDEEAVEVVPGTPSTSKFDWTGCNLSSDNTLTMGLSPGWGDTYDYFRFEQWIDLGQSTLSDGQYVLRSVTDGNNVLWESDTRTDPAREANNEALTPFSIAGGAMQDSTAPSGTVWINGVDTETSNTVVNVKVLGRDDVSGVDTVRFSNDGVTWAQKSYTGANSTPMDVSWDLSDTRYGGSSAAGPHTVHVQFRDRSGKWSPSITDTISLVSCTVSSASSNYSAAVNGDAPVSYWRLGEPCGTAAADERGVNNGTYVNSPALAQPSLLAADGANTSAGFDGAEDHVAIPHGTSLNLGSAFSLEAWIKPNALPPTGGWASVLTKAESYSLQFNGPRLEFTIIQNGARRRLQAPAGAIAAGGTYHVVGTHDGVTQRLYVNGAQVASIALSGGATATTNPLRIASWDGAGEFFNGTVDEVAVYNKTLTASQVANHEATGRASAPTKPAAPTGLAATAAASDAVDLRWVDNATNESGFVLERSTSADFAGATPRTFAPGVVSYRDGGLAATTTYYYRVKATNSAGDSDWSNTASATTPAAPAPPSAPTGLTATASGASAIALAWTDTSTDETGFVLERSTTADFATVTSRALPAGTTSTSDTGLAASTTYSYRVKATNAAGASAPSNTASATTAAPPATTGYAETIAADGPVSYWRLGEPAGTVAADERAANPGTYAGGATLGDGSLLATDPANRAVRLDGVDDQVVVPPAPSLDLTSSFTLEAWIRPSAIPASGKWASVLTKQEAYSLQFNGSRLEFTVIPQKGSRQRLQAPTGAVVAGTTYHVVATFDGRTQRLYLNGAQVGSRSYTGAAIATTSPLRIGSWDGLGEFFAGTVDDVAVYDKVLTATQVAAHNTKGRTG